jgi:hypothetical protein
MIVYDPEPAVEGDIQMEYLSDYLSSPSIGAVTKKIAYNLTIFYRFYIFSMYLYYWFCLCNSYCHKSP